MHIGFVSPQYPPGLSANGISTYTAVMAEELARQGHGISIFSQMPEHESSAHAVVESAGLGVCRVAPQGFRVPVLRIAFYRIGHRLFPGYFQDRDYGLALRRAVRRAHREHRIDVIECPEVRGLARWVQSLGMPVVVRLHTPKSVCAIVAGEPKDYLFRGVARAERRCLCQAKFRTAPSRAVVAETEKVLGIRLNGVHVIPNPCCSAAHRRSQPESRDVRGILFVGRTELLKGFDTLIAAFKQLAAQPAFRDVRLRVVGPDRGLLSFDKTHVSGAEYVRQVVRDEAVCSRIELMGALPHDEVQKFRKRACVTVIPSRFENFPNTLLEAMGAGCPVVASNAGGIPEIVQHERNGLLFRSGDGRDLAKQVARLLVDADLRARLTAQAVTDTNTRYAPDIVAKRMAQFYEEVAEGSDGRQTHPWRKRHGLAERRR